ncbi:MAG: hypothetical protein HY617_03485 [Candidatus Sungbacteria bacterium]|nr:hypothetical protein [Candidatus Sungbacteria bacterium]
MNRENPNVYLGGGVLLTVVALLAWWGGYITNGYTVIGMAIAATLGLFFFAINTSGNKWLWGVVVVMFAFYLAPFPYYFFTTQFPDLLGETGAVTDLKKQTELFLAETLRGEKIVAQELMRCNTIMIADQKPFIEGPTGLEEVARYKATGRWSQSLYEQWHAHNIAGIRQVHEQRRQCGERAALLSPSAKSAASTKGSASSGFLMPNHGIVHAILYEWHWAITFLLVPFIFGFGSRIVLGPEFIKSNRAKAVGGVLAVTWFVVVMCLRAP